MKFFFMTALIAATFVTGSINAQDFTGILTYESKTEIPPITDEALEGVPPEMREMVKQMSLGAKPHIYTLSFNKVASFYQEVEQPVDISDGNVVMQVVTEDDEINYYVNLKENKLVQQVSFFDKEFLVSDSLNRKNWKLEPDTKVIGGYKCKKATYIKKANEKDIVTLEKNPDKDTVVTAWYTTDIPVSFGPDTFYGLPGLVLEVQDGKRTIQCSKIVLNPTQKPVIEEPVKGKKVTRKEYEKIALKKMKELENSRPMNQFNDKNVHVIMQE